MSLCELATVQQAFPSRMVAPQEEHRILEVFGHAEELLLEVVRRLEQFAVICTAPPLDSRLRGNDRLTVMPA